MTSPHSAALDDPPARTDPVRDAEAMATRHLARREEVERVASVVRWLDDLVRIPGTRLGVGLDAIVGLLLPGIGDTLTGIVGLSVVGAAIRRGVPSVVVARMLVNLGVDWIVGIVPIVGDVFDLVWRAHARNLALLERHQGELEPRARTSDYVMVGVAAAVMLATAAAPFVLGWLVLGALS